MATRGAGGQTCSKFLEDVEGPTDLPEGQKILELQYYSWAQGFMTGLNARTPGQTLNLATFTDEEWMFQFREVCR
jgi:hypothetical protein